jgi:hypothetical protein
MAPHGGIATTTLSINVASSNQTYGGSAEASLQLSLRAYLTQIAHFPVATVVGDGHCVLVFGSLCLPMVRPLCIDARLGQSEQPSSNLAYARRTARFGQESDGSG